MQPDALGIAVDFAREALVLAVLLALPLLGAGLVIGLAVSVLQAATQVQETSLGFLPKLLAVAATLFMILPWMLGALTDYATGLFRALGERWLF
ncbi:MAG: flagellar type III secretion system protein FliQ [Planctomycetes bacterium]|nr:flagellar type III secretion system protein FliQ [Planctomycetota bacterium]